MLADALLARDCAALLGGDDLPPHLFELVAHGLQPRRQRVALGELGGALRRALLRGVDTVYQRAHVAEQRHDLELRLVVLAPVLDRVRRAPVECDLDSRLHALACLAQPDGVRPRHDTWPARAPVRHRRRTRDARRLVLHRPDHPVEPAPRARRDGVDELALPVQHVHLDGPVQMPRALVVRDDCAVWRVLADEGRVALGPSAGGGHALLGRPPRKEGDVHRERLVGERPERRQVIDDPDAAAVRRQHQVAIARMDLQIAHRDAREVAAAELRPAPATVDGDEETELGPQEEQILFHRVFLDHVRIAAHGAGGARDARPALPEILRPVHPWRHVAMRMPVERGVGRSRLEPAGLDPGDPARFRQAGHVPDRVGPLRAGVARELHVAVVGADPDRARIERRLADHRDGGVRLRRGVVHGDATGLLLALLLRIVGGQVRRDAVPRVAAVFRTEEELRAEVNDALVRRARSDGRVPVEAQLLLVSGRWLYVARRHRPAIDPADEAALRLDVDRLGIRGVRHRPEPVAAVEVLPAPVADAAAVSRVADPGAVVLQAAVDVVGVRFVYRHVIELRDRKVLLLPPAVRAVDRLPEPAVLADDEVQVGLEETVAVRGIDDKPREVERPPHHRLAAIEGDPALAAVIGAVERRVLRLDEGVDALRGRGCDHDLDAAPGVWGQAVPLDGSPGLAAVGGAQERAAARRLRPVSSRAERPALAPEVPRSGEEQFGILRIHRQARAARRGVARVAQNQRPGLAAVAGAVHAALLAVAPALARDAGADHVPVLRMHADAGDALGLGQAHVGPRFASVGGLVDPVADGDGVARPGLAGADPDGARVAWVDGDRADRLHGLFVEYRPEARAAVLALPNAPARGADVDERLAVDVRGREGGDAAAHRGRADVAHAQAGDDALIERDLGGRRDRRPFERGRARLGPGDDLARDGALRVLEHAVIDRSVGLRS